MNEQATSKEIVDAALHVHRRLGPGLLERTYEACLAYELTKRSLEIKQQVPMPVVYDEVVLDIGYRMDMLVCDKVVVELKAVEQLLPVHASQLLSYLRLGNYRLGLLLNFHTPQMAHGIKRVVNGF